MAQSDVIPGNEVGWPRSEMQRQLAHHHVVGGLNKFKAALKAGYKEQTAEKLAAVMIKEMAPYCATLETHRNDRIKANLDVTVDRISEELARIGFYNPKDYIRVIEIRGVPKCIGKPINELTDDQARAIESWTTERCVTDEGLVYDYRYNFYSKPGAVSDLGRYMGMFNERLILEARVTKHHKVDLSNVPDEVLEKWMSELEEHAGAILEGTAELVEETDG